jgi:hypothetical protein
MATWAQGMKLRDVILTREGDDVETLGPMKWTDLTADVRKIFMKANNIKLSQSLRKSSELGRNVANHMKAQDLKDQIKGPMKEKTAAAVKPSCITKEGTLFRVANIIIQKKEWFIETKGSHDWEDQDSRRPKPAAWQLMCEFYNSNDVAAEELSPHAKNKLIGFSIEDDVCKDYDKLNHSEFEACVIYLNHHYRIARNKNAASGYHGSFGGCVGGKVYLLYYHECLAETGDKALSSCAYPTLQDGIRRTSVESYKPRSQRNQSLSSASECTLSPLPNSDNFRARKYSAVDATKEAARAIAERQHEMNSNDKFDHMVKMRENEQACSTEVSKLKRKYKSAKNKGAKTETLRQIMEQYKHKKQTLKLYVNEYNRLKQEIGFESGNASDSLSSGSEEDDHSDGKNDSDNSSNKD